jgi:hypothetical protein
MRMRHKQQFLSICGTLADGLRPISPVAGGHGKRAMSEELERERWALRKADRDIADGEQRISRQIRLIDELDRDGHDTVAAKDLLATMRTTLEEWRHHRALIVAEIERLEAKG